MKHTPHKYLLAPQTPVTVNLVGAGGTGSEMLSRLVKIDYALRELEHPGLYITVWDNSVVRHPNVGRQQYNVNDCNEFKADVLVSRVNSFLNTDIQSRIELFDGSNTEDMANITITATDTVESRIEVGKALKMKRDYAHFNRPLYWLDLGNGYHYGQAILGSVFECDAPLKTVLDIYPDLKAYENKDEKSCSFAESISKQDLFINDESALQGAKLLWKLFYREITGMETNAIMFNQDINFTTKMKIA